MNAGQCGFCLSGILITTKTILDRNTPFSREEIKSLLNDHLCRCGCHNRVLDAVQSLVKERCND